MVYLRRCRDKLCSNNLVIACDLSCPNRFLFLRQNSDRFDERLSNTKVMWLIQKQLKEKEQQLILKRIKVDYSVGYNFALNFFELLK